MKIIHNGIEYVSQNELMEKECITKAAMRKRRERGQYKEDEVLVLPERVYYKVK